MPKLLTFGHVYYISPCCTWDEKFEESFFHLAGGRRMSLRHVVAIDPLVDSIPKLTIDARSSAVLHCHCQKANNMGNISSTDRNYLETKCIMSSTQ